MVQSSMGGRGDQPVFFYDLGSPYSYLAAERVGRVVPVAQRWQPILLGALFKRFGSASWAHGPERGAHQREIATRAAAYGLPAVRWPEPWPGNTLRAMRAATAAAQQGRGEEFARAAFRHAFVDGRDLTLADEIAAVARAVGFDPETLAGAAESPAVKDALRIATEQAADLGVHGVPSVLVAGCVFFGDDQLEAAAAAARA